MQKKRNMPIKIATINKVLDYLNRVKGKQIKSYELDDISDSIGVAKGIRSFAVKLKYADRLSRGVYSFHNINFAPIHARLLLEEVNRYNCGKRYDREYKKQKLISNVFDGSVIFDIEPKINCDEELDSEEENSVETKETTLADVYPFRAKIINEQSKEISELKEEISMLKEDNINTINNFYKTLSTQQKLIEQQIKTIDELKIEKDMLLKQFLILLNK
jgi:hypothetical protein